MNSTLGDENERMRGGPYPSTGMATCYCGSLTLTLTLPPRCKNNNNKTTIRLRPPASEQSIQSAARSGRQRAAWNPKPVARRDGGPLLSIGSGSVSVCAVRASSLLLLLLVTTRAGERRGRGGTGTAATTHARRQASSGVAAVSAGGRDVDPIYDRSRLR